MLRIKKLVAESSALAALLKVFLSEHFALVVFSFIMQIRCQ
jgi:hypothetical protein